MGWMNNVQENNTKIS